MSKYGKIDSRNEYFKKEQAKENSLAGVEADIDSTIDLTEITVDPKAQIELANFYNGMPEVQVDNKIYDFWNEQQKQIDTLKPQLASEKSNYLSAYNRFQSIEESIESRLGYKKGVENIDKQLRDNAKEISKIESQKAKMAFERISIPETDPIKYIFGRIAGTKESSDYRKQIKSQMHQLAEKRRNLKNNLKNLKKTRKHLEAKKAVLSIQLNGKRDFYRYKKKTALYNIAKLKVKARAINSNSIKAQQILAQKYEVINKYKTIQAFRNSKQFKDLMSDPAKKTQLKTQNPQLFEALNNFPNKIPDNYFVVSTDRELKLPENIQGIDKSDFETKLSSINSNISQLKSQLPDYLKNVSQADYKINYIIDNSTKKVDYKKTLETIKTKMQGLDPNSQEYQILADQIEYLEIKEKCNSLNNSLENNKTKIAKLEEILKNPQEVDKIYKNELSEYEKKVAKIDTPEHRKEIEDIYTFTNMKEDEKNKIVNDIINKEIEEKCGKKPTLESTVQKIQANLNSLKNQSTTLENDYTTYTNAANTCNYKTFSPIFKELQNLTEKKKSISPETVDINLSTLTESLKSSSIVISQTNSSQIQTLKQLYEHVKAQNAQKIITIDPRFFIALNNRVNSRQDNPSRDDSDDGTR